MVHLRPLTVLFLVLLSVSPTIAAGPIEERVQRHIEAAKSF